LLATAAFARDDGRYANSSLKQWFESLKSQFGQCCTNADGYIVSDPDWESDRGHYRVRMDGEWVLVPDGAVITQPNRARSSPPRKFSNPAGRAGVRKLLAQQIPHLVNTKHLTR
jgi:hypothetical protein